MLIKLQVRRKWGEKRHVEILLVCPWCEHCVFVYLRNTLCAIHITTADTTHTFIFNQLSVQFSCSLTSDSLQPHELQHARPPCPSPSPRVYSDSCPLSQWCHPTISSSVVPFSHHQSFPASRSFQMSQFFASGGQSIGVSASASVLPMNTQNWSPLEWTGWISLQPRDFEESSPTPQFKSINSLAFSLLHSPTLTSIHDHWKNHSLD